MPIQSRKIDPPPTQPKLDLSKIYSINNKFQKTMENQIKAPKLEIPKIPII